MKLLVETLMPVGVQANTASLTKPEQGQHRKVGSDRSESDQNVMAIS